VITGKGKGWGKGEDRTGREENLGKMVKEKDICK